MSDSLDFERVLSVCLDRLRAGDTLEDCLASYPAYETQLAPLLSVAEKLQTPGGPWLSPAGFSAGEARLLARAAQLRPRRGRMAAARPISGFLAGLRRRLAAGVALTLVLGVALSAGAVSAASDSLPGSRLYPLKRNTESLIAWAAVTPQLKARVHLAWADRRLREIEALAARDGLVDDALLAALNQETEQALDAAEQAGLEPLVAAAAHTEHQQAVLSRVLANAPVAARPGLERALEASGREHARARSALERAAKHGPPATPSGQAGGTQPPDTPPATLPGVEASPPISTPGAQDTLTPADKGHGQGVGPAAGQGAGQGRGQDKATQPNPGQRQGEGSGKDEEQPPGQGGGQGRPPDPGQGSGQGHDGGKPDKPEHPGQDKNGK